MYYVYFVKSSKNDKVYIGFTSKDPKIRLQEHNQGVSKFTKHLKPWKLIYYESYKYKRCAQDREKFYKTGVGKQIKKIIIDNFSGCGSVG